MDKNYALNIEKEMRKGLIEFAVLLIISKQKTYASDILTVLKQAKLITSEGTMYPLLSRLVKEKYVKYYWEESKNGPPRKYYVLDKIGLEALEIYKSLWTKITDSINFLINKNG